MGSSICTVRIVDMITTVVENACSRRENAALSWSLVPDYRWFR